MRCKNSKIFLWEISGLRSRKSHLPLFFRNSVILMPYVCMLRVQQMVLQKFSKEFSYFTLLTNYSLSSLLCACIKDVGWEGHGLD
jgi:hypothetical protein